MKRDRLAAGRALGVPTRIALLVALLTMAGACATPVGVTRQDPKVLYRALSKSVLSADAPSTFTEQLLRRRGLDDAFENNPEAMLAELHRTRTTRDSDRLFALAELSFLHGRENNKREYVLAAAVYAYAFLVSRERRAETMPAADPRVRWAVDLYNIALTFGLTETISANGLGAPHDEVVLTERTLDLPFGRLQLRNRPEQFLWGGYRLTRFIRLIDYKVRGLRNRYRQPGIGMPLAAEVTPIEGPEADRARKRIPPTAKVPITAFVRFDNVAEGLVDGQLRGAIELHAVDEATTVEAEGTVLPLELDPTAALALALEGAPVWDTELAGFLRAGRSIAGDGLFMMHPYRRGRVPVILVHGTASSPARWAEIVNEVQNDPVLRAKVQVWLFMYNTSNPILLSAERLRTALQTVVADVDPDGHDPALKRMVLMGHSQGGMLTRLMVTDSGDRFWANVSAAPLDDLKMSPEVRDLVRRAMFFKPVPSVTRVVFLATPHQGSFRVSSLVLGAVRRLVTLPVALVKDFGDILQRNPDLATHVATRRLPTAVDNMLPTHPFVRTLSASPLAPGVAAHSIIAVLGTGSLLGLNDGVVAYRSAHLEGVESEKIVQSSHSLQSNPATIQEVRRILREHVDAQ
jgi:pimeloyl-ACP methyl ester carboxylesterase